MAVDQTVTFQVYLPSQQPPPVDVKTALAAALILGGVAAIAYAYMKK